MRYPATKRIKLSSCKPASRPGGSAVVFVLDLATPLGLPYWLLYGLPFFFIRSGTPRQVVYGYAALCTLLLFVGYALSHEGKAELLAHRALAVIVLWVVALQKTRRTTHQEVAERLPPA